MSEAEKIDESDIPISEQIERTSVNIITFSALSETSGMPTNIPNILGGEAIITDEVAKLKVEEAFGQLNIQSVFGFEEHMIQSCLYDTFHIGEDTKGKLTPHIYLLKSHFGNIYLLNLLTTPYADLNLDAYFKEVEFMSRSFSGVFRRTNKQIDDKIIDDEEQDAICKVTVGNLSGYMHYQIFQERGLREMVRDSVKKATSMVVGMFFELSVVRTEHQCMGDCGKTFEKDDVMFEGKNPEETSCPECQGELTYAPPVVKLDNVRFVFPENATKILTENDPAGASPIKYLSYITNILMPRNISLTTNRLSPEHFSTLVAIPSKATFANPNNPDEYISISTQWRPRGDKIFLFCSIGNSLYSDRKDTSFIPQLTAITINRAIIEGFKKGKDLETILKSSIISDWKLTGTFKIAKLSQYETIDDLLKGDV